MQIKQLIFQIEIKTKMTLNVRADFPPSRPYSTFVTIQKIVE